MNRSEEIIKTGFVGIACNVFLAVFKFAVGLLSNSVSIRMDALNNLTDALSSVITIVGTKLSERKPDRKHPFGYGRIEYLTSLLIGIFILYAGFGALRESVFRIIHPEPVDYSVRSLVIVAAAIIVKILLGHYTSKRGRLLDSAALAASGHEALIDSVTSAATLVAALIYVFSGASIEAYVGAVIAILIIKAGADLLRETISDILGERVDEELIVAVRNTILSFPEVDGVFDLTIHNYGQEKLIGTAHIEVPDTLKSSWIDNLQREITKKVLEKTGVEMMGLTIYAENTQDEEAVEMRKFIRDAVNAFGKKVKMHGFYLDKVDKAVRFDVVTDFDVTDGESICRKLTEQLKAKYPEYEIDIVQKSGFVD